MIKASVAHAVRRLVPERWRPIGYLTGLVLQKTDGRVMGGPFGGIRYIDRSVGSAYLPKVLGIYERELNRCIETVCTRRPTLIVDVGAAEGYYAVGLAVRNPEAQVIAFEMEEAGRRALGEMARLNDVSDRIEVRGRCEPADLQAVLEDSGHSEAEGTLAEPVAQGGGRALAEPLAPGGEWKGAGPVVICDVEGYEEALLDPAAVPALRGTSILVELHDFLVPGITEELVRRFEPTHRVEHIWQEPRSRDEFPWRTLGTRLLPGRYLDWAVSEWRPVRMAWLWMQPSAKGRCDSA